MGMAGGATIYAAINSASDRYGVPADYMLLKAQQESSFDVNARARTSSATGLYQFLDQTWLGTFKRHGADLGPEGAELARHIHQSRNGHFHVDAAYRSRVFALREDANAAAHMGAAFAADNARDLQRAGIEVNNTTLYAAHFFGSAGAIQFMRGLENDPNGSAASYNSAAAAANHGVFYGRGGRARSNAEVYAWMESRMGGPGSGTFTGGDAGGGYQAQAAPPQPQMTALQAAFFGLGGGTVSAPSGIDPGTGEAAPPEEAAPPQPQERSMWSTIGHGILGVASFIPGVSVIAGGIDAAWYTAEGDYVNAGLAAASMIPGGKWVTTAGKLAYRGARAAGAGVRVARVAARTTAVGARVTRGAGALAREARLFNVLSGGAVSGGLGGVKSTDEGPDLIALIFAKKAMDYIRNKGLKQQSPA